ncbi:hypothetical protein AMIS_74880 [Actinoplanes missouriensis 431]|uniref:Uncharacterized protein n=1 Tax=Actinoplanes missouriensis (strain ATCC 14538 / DSM 43046 / CBS 188.64 / JCM 3121 / NBRC 102363 / NCIMB 12654 / NRRL B-3342 / UNCC 431) TaxID=512565 RepID=I0HI71_ACTM4|nr:hypothetical protein [Actinoplanes missouriensis]BAL92708.1 hypothetical protein AMIS_74880 [Actinoplanes missouriensis 431]
MGTLVTLQLPPGSPIADLPWVVTIGALGDPDEWDPVVCGPYERDHALALARAVVADDDLMAVVEPLQPLDGVEAIRREIELARTADFSDADTGAGSSAAVPGAPPEPGEVRAGWRRIAAGILTP